MENRGLVLHKEYLVVVIFPCQIVGVGVTKHVFQPSAITESDLAYSGQAATSIICSCADIQFLQIITGTKGFIANRSYMIWNNKNPEIKIVLECIRANGCH